MFHSRMTVIFSLGVPFLVFCLINMLLGRPKCLGLKYSSLFLTASEVMSCSVELLGFPQNVFKKKKYKQNKKIIAQNLSLNSLLILLITLNFTVPLTFIVTQPHKNI